MLRTACRTKVLGRDHLEVRRRLIAGTAAWERRGPVGSVASMDIVAALFFEDLDTNQAFAGGPTRIDLKGVHFSAPAPQEPPVTMAPHMVVLVRCAPDEKGTGALEVRFLRDGEQIARNAQPLQVEPGKFAYRLVRAELPFEAYDTIEAHCSVDGGPVTVVPYTLVPGAG